MSAISTTEGSRLFERNGEEGDSGAKASSLYELPTGRKVGLEGKQWGGRSCSTRGGLNGGTTFLHALGLKK